MYLKILGFTVIVIALFDIVLFININVADDPRPHPNAYTDHYHPTFLHELRLEEVNPEKYKIAKDLNHNALFTEGEVEFFMVYDYDWEVYGNSYADRYCKKVMISKIDLENSLLDFEVTIAHELGHIQNNSPDQSKADEFAARIFGKERVLNWLRSFVTIEEDRIEYLSNLK